MKNKLAFVLVAVLVSAGLLSVAGNAAADTRAYANQAPEEEWTRTFGGSGWDVGFSVRQTSDGGYIIAGCTGSYGAGGRDVWLIKTDSGGNELWNRTFGGSSGDRGYSVQQTSDGGYIIAGRTKSYGAGYTDAWVIKTDSKGNEEWNKTFGGSGNDCGWSVQQTSDGGYIIIGETSVYLSLGYLWLIKTDAQGNKQWDRVFHEGKPGYSVHQTLIQTSDGGYIITGYVYPGSGFGDACLLKTDSNGNKQWNKTFGEPWGTESGRSVQQTSDGGYIITGTASRRTNGCCDADVWLIKTDSEGNELWNRTFGGSSDDEGYSVQQTSDGGYIIAGDTCSYGAGGDVWLIKVKGEGIPNQPPVASFSYSPQNPVVNETITFNASASTDPDGTIVSYEWDFGDGNTGSGEIVTHAYASKGSYIVKLKVTDDDGATGTETKVIDVSSVPGMLDVPFFSQTNDTWKDKPLDHSSCTFKDSGCAVTSVAMVLKYFGYDTDPLELNKSLTNIGALGNDCMLRFDMVEQLPGTENIWIKDLNGKAYERIDTHWNKNSQDRIRKELSKKYPVIGKVRYPPYSRNETHFIVFYGVTNDKFYFLDPYDLQKQKREWEAGGLGEGILGSYKLYSLRIYHGNLLPVASFSFSPSPPHNPVTGENITFDASASYDPDGGTITSYKWDFGDGSVEVADKATVTHSYSSEGNYVVTLTVTDDEGTTNTRSKLITVKRLPVVLVHGFQLLRKNPEEVWKTMKQSLESSGFDVHVSRYAEPYRAFDPPTNEDIKKYAEKLGKEIEEIKQKKEVNKVDIVAHSMGGLVSRYYIQSPLYKNDVRKLIMLGTPNKGTELLYSRYVVTAVVLYYELHGMPIPSGFDDAAVYALLGEPGEQMMPGSDFLYKTLTYFGKPNYYTIAGTGGEIGGVRSFEFWGWLFLKPFGGENDGAVRVDSVKLFYPMPAENHNEYPLNHGMLIEDSLTINKVVQILKGLNPTTMKVMRTEQAQTDETPIQEAPLISGKINLGEEQSHEIPITSTDESSIRLLWLEGDLNLTLRTPNGTLIDPSFAINDTNVTYYSDKNLTIEGYTIKNPESGIWKINVTAVNISEEEDYTIMTFLDTNITLSLYLQKYQYALNEPVNISASLMYGS
ncbi:PKD domain-containing protein, partial [Methanophagales archaeon]